MSRVRRFPDFRLLMSVALGGIALLGVHQVGVALLGAQQEEIHPDGLDQGQDLGSTAPGGRRA